METIEAEIVEKVQTPKEFQLILTQNNFELQLAQDLLKTFQPFLVTAQKWQKVVETLVITDASQTKEIELAKRARLEVTKSRIALEKSRKALKENLLRDGRVIDGFSNVCKQIIEPLEKQLLEKEEFVEREEAKRKLELKLRRETALKVFDIDTTGYVLELMPDDSYNQLLENSKLAFERKQQIAKELESKRLADEKAKAEEQAMIRIENIRLQKEALERESKSRKEREALEKKAKDEKEIFEKKAKDEKEIFEKKAKDEKEALEKKAKQERLVFADKLRVEIEAKKKIENELRLKQEFETRAIKQAQEETERKEAAPDKEKLKEFAKQISAIQIPTLTSTKGKILLETIRSQNQRYVDWVDGQITKL